MAFIGTFLRDSMDTTQPCLLGGIQPSASVAGAMIQWSSFPLNQAKNQMIHTARVI